EKIDQATAVTVVGQFNGPVICLCSLAQLPKAGLFLAIGDQRILDIFKRGEDRLLISEQRLLLACVLNLNVLPDATRIEDRPLYRGSQGPELTAARQEVARRHALQPDSPSQEEAGEEIGNGHTDVGSGSRELMLGAPHIRPAAQQVGGK